MADAKADPPKRRPKIFYGWWMALSGMGMSFYTDGAGYYGFSVFFAQIIAAFPQWPVWALAVGPSLQRLQSGVLSPLTGYMVDKIGPRKVLSMGFIVAGIAYMLLSRIEHFWQYYPIFLLVAFGLSAGSFVVSTAAVSNWFSRKRGRAISIVLLGPGLSGLLAALWTQIIPIFGWRNALLLVGLGFWLFCLPLASVMRRRAEDYGQSLDGDDGTGVGATSTQRRGHARDIVLPMRTILRSRSYWQYVVGFSIAASAQSVVLFQVAAMTQNDISLGTAGLVVLWLTVSGVPVRLLSGLLADLFDTRLILAGSIALHVAAVLVFAATDTVGMAFLYATLFGVGTGLRNPARLALQAEYWGRSVFGRLAGIQMGIGSIPGILTPIFIALVFDLTGSYSPAFVVLAALSALSIPLLLTIKRPEEPVATSQAAAAATSTHTPG